MHNIEMADHTADMLVDEGVLSLHEIDDDNGEYKPNVRAVVDVHALLRKIDARVASLKGENPERAEQMGNVRLALYLAWESWWESLPAQYRDAKLVI